MLREEGEKNYPANVFFLEFSFTTLIRGDDCFQAVKTLLVLSEAAGDFLRQRTVKEIIPGISSFMEKQAKIRFVQKNK